MNRITLSIALFLALGTVARAQTGIEVKYKLPKGAKWTVSQTLEVQSGQVDSNGTAAGKANGCPEIHLVESWVDESLADASGKATKIKRTIASSQLNDADSKAEATAMEGAVLTVEREGSKVEPTAGTPEAKTLDFLRKSPPDAIEILLPAKAVKVNDAWDIKKDDFVRFLNSIGASILSAKGSNAEAIKKYFSIRMTAARSFAEGADIKATLTKSADGEVSVHFAGKRDLPCTSKISSGGQDQPTPTGLLEIDGTLTWNTKTGKPLEFNLTITQTQYDGTRMQIGPAGMSMNGIKDVWKIHRAWEETK